MKLLNLVVENFHDCFERAEFNFAEETVIRAMNGSGKSSIAEAVVWCLYGTNILGKTKADGALMRNGAKGMRVLTSWLTASGQMFTIERIKPEKGKISVLVNGMNATPGQIEGLFFLNANEFLSVFIPGFFSRLEPKDAKAILARYSEVSVDEVMSRLLPPQREVFRGDVLGMGFDSVELVRKKTANELREAQAELLRLQGEVRAAEDAIHAGAPEPFESKITDDLRVRAEQKRNTLAEYEVSVRNAKQTVDALTRQKRLLRQTYDTLRAGVVALESIQATCPTCGQSLPHEHVEQTKANARVKNIEIKKELEQMVKQGEEINAKIERLNLLASGEEPERITKIRDGLARFEELEQQERAALAQYQASLTVFQNAEATLVQKREWIERQTRIIEQLQTKLSAVKEFRSLYVQLQQKKLDALFDKVGLVLSRVNDDGEIKDDFQITWNEKPYQSLSTSEKVRCDIEIGRAISALRMTPGAMPVFVDNAEGVQGLFQESFDGQVIAAYVFGSQLLVQSRESALDDLAAEIKNMQSLILKKGA